MSAEEDLSVFVGLVRYLRKKKKKKILFNGTTLRKILIKGKCLSPPLSPSTL